MRNRLVELIADARKEYYDYSDELHEKGMSVPESSEEYIADHLIANGVVVLPCKVGQILYVIEAGKINEAKVKEYKYCSNSNNGIHWHIIFEELFVMSEAHIGKTVFLDREDAERALKGGK